MFNKILWFALLFLLFGTLPARAEKDAVEINKLQAQLQQSIATYEKIKPISPHQATEIQKVIEMEKVHQRLLQDLVQEGAASSPTEEIVRQQKIRLIQEQVLRNQQAVQNFAPPIQAAKAHDA